MRRLNRAPTNHIDFPSPTGRQPDPGLLRGLRAIDPTLDCHYVGDGRWIVGAVRPNEPRRQAAMSLLSRPETHGDPQKATHAMLVIRGFSPIQSYEFTGQAWQHVVRDIRERDWRFRTKPEEAFREKLQTSSKIRRSEEEMMQDVEDRIHAWYPYLFDGRKHFHMGG